jgi:hypothetical protein
LGTGAYFDNQEVWLLHFVNTEVSGMPGVAARSAAVL